ncbi:MAG: hypothetical protein CVU91_07855 [Firmicutes bacterium HGW-Firmicutes-16]|nr:MAG: hypothetical protein CVU91_07855 [Firmicutes bacterium HGW-Firmicutes-16]
MITADILIATPKDELSSLSKELDSDDVELLIEWLSVKEDKLRYPSLLVLQMRSKDSDCLYKYWPVFREKLKSDNSYQRSIGLMMIAANVRWDSSGNFEEDYDAFCALLNDEKPITVRQCVASFAEIVPFKPNLNSKIAETLMSINIAGIRDTMQKSVLLDITNILLLIRKAHTSDAIEKYITDALTGGILDSKSKKAIQAAL